MSFNSADKSRKFRSNTEQLLALTHHRITDKPKIIKQIQELNNIDYKNFSIPDNETVMLLINSLCSIIQVTDSTLITNYSKLICNLIEAGCVLSKRTFMTCKKWILQVLEFSEYPTKRETLFALRSLIDIGTFESISQDVEKLLGVEGLLRVLAVPGEEGVNELNFLAINCVEGLLISKEKHGATLSGQNRKLIKDIIIIVLNVSKLNESNHLFFNKIICSCLRILSLLLSSKLITEDPESTGEILGIVQAFLFYGLPGFVRVPPENLRPAIMNLPDRIHIAPKGRSQRSAKTKSKKSTNKKILDNSIMNNQELLKLPCKSSDSETSDSETINKSRLDSKIRLETINLLYSAIREIPNREMFGYWLQIISSTPDTPSSSSRVLIKLILNDDYSKNRQNALSTLTETINSSKSFLIHADDNEHPSFLTIFGTVGAMIKELHQSLSLLLSTERNIAVITHALKCSSALIQSTPYSRLNKGLATKLARNCRPFIYHKDPTIRVAVLSVYESFSNSHYITPEIETILNQKTKKLSAIQGERDLAKMIDDDLDKNYEEVDEIDVESLVNLEIDDDDEEEEEDGTSQEMTLLVENCLNNITDKTVHIPVRLQSLKLLASLTSNVENSVLNHLDIVTKSLLDTLTENEPQVVLHSCRVIEMISTKLSSTIEKNYNKLKKYWNEIFNSIMELFKNSNTNLREVACDCIGSINNMVLSEFNSSRMKIIIIVLIGAVRDEESAVRAASLRALGLLIALPCLDDEINFIMDLSDLVCQLIYDSNLGVRVKAAWALANLTDCLIRQQKNNHENVEQLNFDFLLPKLYDVCVKASSDNNKIKCNSLRALGNVIYLCDNRDVLGDVSSAINVLIESAKTGNDMKVRWNSCRAIGFILSNKPDDILPTKWKDTVFPVLCELIIHASNFKVRTNAAWALSSCCYYGKYAGFLLKNILIALDNSKHVPNFFEYEHRDALVQQLCLTIASIVRHVDVQDIFAIWNDFKDHVEYVKGYMKTFQERALPEKTRDLVDARLRMIEVSQDERLKEAERKIAGEIAGIFDTDCC